MLACRAPHHPSTNMRLSTLATWFLSALLVSAQTTLNVTEIFLELAQLPECAVSNHRPSSSVQRT